MIRRLSIAVASGRGVAERWRQQYERQEGGWIKVAGGHSKEIYDKLCDLGSDPDIKKVAKVIGNQSWSYLTCSGCSKHVERAVDFGSDFSDQNILLCEECVADAAGALKKAKAA